MPNSERTVYRRWNGAVAENRMTVPVYFHVPGTIVVLKKMPDGDSVRFVPDDPAALAHIRRAHLLRPTRTDGSLQLRLEGIDAPETHYGGYAQPFGDEARDHFLKTILGFESLDFHGETVTAATPATLPAAILTQAADVHGRPIAYLLTGTAAENPFGEAAMGEVDAALVRRSANFRMVADGFAYVLRYTSMPRPHQDAFAAAAEHARQAQAAETLWPLDHSLRFPLTGRQDLEAGGPEPVLIFPKLFRRAMDFFTAVDKGFTGDLIAWLRQTPAENDQVLIGGRHPVPLSELIKPENDRYRFEVDVNDVVFIEK